MQRGAPGEMTTREAVSYLNEWLDFAISEKSLHRTRAVLGVPLAEKRESRLVFRRKDLDAFLAEFGTDPRQWNRGWSRDAISQLHARGIHEPQIEAIATGLDPGADDPDPSEAHR